MTVWNTEIKHMILFVTCHSGSTTPPDGVENFPTSMEQEKELHTNALNRNYESDNETSNSHKTVREETEHNWKNGRWKGRR